MSVKTSCKRKVYAIYSGEYGDYGVECVFSSKEKAEEYLKTQHLFVTKRDKGTTEHHIEEIIFDAWGSE